MIRIVPRATLTPHPPRVLRYPLKPSALPDDVITLNVGGTTFQTLSATAAKIPKLAGVTTFGFFDRDARTFEVILNSCRRDIPPSQPAWLSLAEWRAELAYWGVRGREEEATASKAGTEPETRAAVVPEIPYC